MALHVLVALVTETDKFLSMVLASRLATSEELRQAFDEFSESRNAGVDTSDFADHLVTCGLLTRWQCDMLMRGRYKGFFLDHYMILDQENDRTYFRLCLASPKP